MPAKGFAGSVELRAQLGEIVDLAVERDDKAAVGRCHRLVTGLGKVDDRQPRKAEARAPFAPAALVVGPAVMQSLDRILDRSRNAFSQDGAYDAAHGASPAKIASSFSAFAAQVNSASARGSVGSMSSPPG